MLCCCGMPVWAQVNSLVTDGSRPFAEGILTGYTVQDGGRTVCTDPYVIGQYISCIDTVRIDGNEWRAGSTKRVRVDTNGVLGAMIVINAKGRVLCSDPTVSIEFRGPESYVVCE
jgi:hypothetical protein